MDQQIDNMKTPCRKTRQINIESKTEICNKAGRKGMPEFSEIQGLKGMVFKDVGDIIELESAGKSVGVDRDPEEQDQEETGPCG
jgi:hypothetical protein